MKFVNVDVVFQEVPDEISLCFTISGCTLKCKGCHSTYLWFDVGQELTEDVLIQHLTKYTGMITNIIFMGGEWESDNLLKLLKLCKNYKYKTTLYTGLDLSEVPSNLMEYLDYLKVGRWVEELGGLDKKTTNQKFYKLPELENLTYKFHKE